MTDGYQPTFQTRHFDVFHQHITRNPKLGVGRDIYTAWYRHQDIPRPVCIVTLFGNWVEWIEVTDDFRRLGIATEVREGLIRHVGELQEDAGSELGEKFLQSVGVDVRY